MAYNLLVSDEMDGLLDNCVYYLLNKSKNEQAAIHLLSGVDKIYDELEDNYPELLLEYVIKKPYTAFSASQTVNFYGQHAENTI